METKMKNLPWKNFEKTAKAVIASQTFHNLDEVRQLVEYRYTYQKGINEIIDEILKFNFKFSTLGIDWNFLVSGIIRSFNARPQMFGSWENVVLYEEEITQLKSISLLAAQQIMFFLLIIYKWNSHPSGWIDFTRYQGFVFWDLQNYTRNQQEEVMRVCCAHGLELRVVGSKEPMICFHINWVQNTGKVVAQLKSEDEIKSTFWQLVRNERADF